jgi:PhoH-like ATPase
MSKIVVDTNCLIDNPELLLDSEHQYAISYVTLQELDKHKSNPDLSYPARSAIKIIYQLFREGKIDILNVPTEGVTNDEKIVNDCKDIDGILMSQDIGALVVAQSRQVETYDLAKVDKEWDKTFKGYLEIIIDDKAYYRLTQNEYMVDEIEVLFEDLNISVPLNSYLVLYPESSPYTNYLVWRKFEDKYTLVPQSTKHLRSAGIGLDWLHPEQLIAFDCVFNTESKLAVITGKVGSSKTLMSMCGALARTVGHKNKKSYDKILVTRPNIPINKAYALGFMKGSLEEKMSGWLAPIKTNLQFLYENTLKDRENEEATKIYDEFFQAMPIESIQGASYHNKILLTDEAQLLDSNTLKQIMSRVAEGSKLVLILDPNQTYGANRGQEGYKKLLPHCKGNKHISFVELQHIQRSELVKVVDEIFK